MSVALSAEWRSLLERFVQRARSWVEEDLGSALEGRFGIHLDGELEPVEALSLTTGQLAVRADLVEIVEYLRTEGEDAQGSVERLVREAAFTHTNRLIAVRVAEAIGLLPETMANGLSSSGFRDFSELAPTVADTEWGRFAVFVRLCADELAADVPALFDPRNPLLELELSEGVLAQVIEAVRELPNELWEAPDTLGWAYQFFNTGEERRGMRESSAPRTSRELAVRNQFFTPSYVVEFLVQNGLGAHLAAGYPALADELPLLVELPSEERKVDLRQVSVLDPACGSGHFLLGAYDVLERAWHHAGVNAEDAAPSIVSSLWGVDIDPRAAQIAQAAVMFRARRHRRSGALPSANVICARALPLGPQTDELIGALPERVARAVRRVSEELTDAPLLGPLLKIEERLSREVRDVFGTGTTEGTLPEVDDTTTDVENAVLEALREIADSTTSSAAQRLFVAEAHDAVNFVEAMTRRYTAVLMNPPFGDPVTSTRQYLKAAYPANSTRTADLFASFVDRGRELCEATGSVGAITTRAGLFLQSYEKWREQIFLANERVLVADLGFGIMEQAMVEAAAYVLDGPGRLAGQMTVIDVLDRMDRPAAVSELAEAARSGRSVDGVFELQIQRLQAIPGMRIAYWAGDVIGKLFERLPPLEHDGIVVRRGIQTGDDFRFIRLPWEVARDDQNWRFLSKGGRYHPLLPDSHLVVNWSNNGRDLIDFEGSIVPSADLYFRSGVTWSRRTNSAFGPRLMEGGVAFGDKGPGIIGGNPLWNAAYLNTRLVRTLIETMVSAGESTTSGSASRSYDTGLVGLLPFVSPDDVTLGCLDRLWESMVGYLAATAWKREPYNWHRFPLKVAASDNATDVVALAQGLEGAELEAALDVLAAYDEFDAAVSARAADICGIDVPELETVLSSGAGKSLRQLELSNSQSDLEQVGRYWQLGLEELIDELIEQHGGSRNVANLSHIAHRRLEVIAHGTSAGPTAVAHTVAALGVTSQESIADVSAAVVSCCASMAFGVEREPRTATDPLQLLQTPTMTAPKAESDLLLDGPGHDLDFAGRTVRLASELNVSALLESAAEALGWKGDIEGAIRRNFFKLHLSMYSMSRRKAPIYWQLQVPSKQWGVWLYAPELSREMLFAIVSETEHRQRSAEQQIAHLEREASSGTSGKSASALAKGLESEQKLAVELASFRAEAERIANLGWEPDPNDGMVLNAAPLADLFPAWKDAAKYRKEVRAGKHEWATVARYADQL